MIDGSEKCNHQFSFELQNLHVCEKHRKVRWKGNMGFYNDLLLVL